MTNVALVRIFFMGVATGKEESYGLSIKPSTIDVTKSPAGYLVKTRVGDLALFSKTSHFPLARKISENYFIISTPGSGVQSTKGSTLLDLTISGSWRKHLSLATMIAKQIGVGLLSSPLADETKFQRYMESKINGDLTILARTVISSLNTLALNPELILTELYQNLIKNIRILLEGEILLKLSKHQAALLDTDEVQVLWAWLIKESPVKEDRELLREMYVLSRLLGSP